MRAEGVSTLIGVPIVSAGRAIGLIECCKVDAAPWSRLQLRHARIVATVLGPVLGTLQQNVRQPDQEAFGQVSVDTDSI